MDTAGRRARHLLSDARVAARAFFASITIQLTALVGIFIALPFVLYGQLEDIDRQTRNLVMGSIQHKSWLTAQAIKPLLDLNDVPDQTVITETLSKFAEDGTILRLLLRPADATDTDTFYFVASAPRIPEAQVKPELESLAHGVLKSLSSTCSWGTPIEFRYEQAGGKEEVLTSVIPLNARGGCWVLISSHNSTAFLRSSMGRPYWATDGIRTAGLAYLALAVLAAFVVANMRRGLRRFRAAAREIRRGGVGKASFTSRNVIPELSSVAEDVDQLVHDLHQVAADIRQTTEDNAHAVKTPLAVIRAALEPLKRAAADLDQRARRSIEVIESSTTRLLALVSAAQYVGRNTADFIEAPKLRINLGDIVREAVDNARDIANERGIDIRTKLDKDACVWAPDDVLDVMVENVLDNALSFTPPGKAIEVTLKATRKTIELHVDDEGPGIDPMKISQIFNRYFSSRPPDHADAGNGEEPGHSGLGLWIVRHSAEALGGNVSATNRPGGGLSLRIVLPAASA